MENLHFYSESLKEFLDSSNQKHSFVEQSLKKLQEAQLPTRKNESWKYTNLKSLSGNFDIHVPSQENYKFNKKSGFTNLFFLDGVFQKDHSDDNPFELGDINQDSVKIIDETYYQDDVTHLLANSNLQNGISLRLKSKTICETPIHIHYHFTGKNSLRIYNEIFEIENFAQAKVLQTVTSESDEFIVFRSFTHLGDESHFTKSTIQDVDKNSQIMFLEYSNLGKNSHYNNCLINSGAALSRTNIHMELSAEGATGDSHGLYALTDKQHHDTMSYIQHKSPHTYSHQLYKGILNDSSRGIFTGKVRVEKDAQLINAEQLNKNLLLTKKAHANSRPQMEIYADDVKCAHGSTTGQLSEDELFYFESRGIKAQKARKILANAFSLDVILKINDVTIQNEIKEFLKQKNIVEAK